MRVTTTDGIEVFLLRESETSILIYGTSEALECVTDGLILSGTEHATGVVPHTVDVLPSDAPSGSVGMALRVSPGTVAVWLSFEALNML